MNLRNLQGAGMLQSSARERKSKWFFGKFNELPMSRRPWKPSDRDDGNRKRKSRKKLMILIISENLHRKVCTRCASSFNYETHNTYNAPLLAHSNDLVGKCRKKNWGKPRRTHQKKKSINKVLAMRPKQTKGNRSKKIVKGKKKSYVSEYFSCGLLLGIGICMLLWNLKFHFSFLTPILVTTHHQLKYWVRYIPKSIQQKVLAQLQLPTNERFPNGQH